MSDYTADLNNAARPEADIVTAGQPTASQLQAAADDGVQTIINLRPEGEFNEYNEPRVVADAGMRYLLIPVATPEDINDETARQLDEALAGDGKPAMVHCASSNRVGALMAYRARHIQGKSAEEALQIGLDAGLNPTSPLLQATQQKIE